MKVIIQRVKSARVEIENKVHGEIQHGYLLFVCFEQDDTLEIVQKGAEKVFKLRIFADEQDRMNLNISQVNGEILSISQFTLSWQGEKGHRPSFERSLNPAQARLYYAKFNQYLVDLGCPVKQGVFGADMQVFSHNDGPVTFHLSIED